MPTKPVKNSVLISILSVLCLLFATTSGILIADKYLPKFSLTSAGLFSTREEVINLIQKESIDNLPNKDKISEGEIKGLVASLNDPYSEYLSKEDDLNFQNELNQRYEGIGVGFSFAPEKISINKVLKNSPAQDAGLQKGDVLKQIDGQNIEEIEQNQVASKIRGPKNTLVKLKFERGNQLLDFSLNRKNIESELVTLEIKDDIALVTISSFGDNIDSKMNNIASEIKNNPKISKIILDLRSNTGGLLRQAIEISSYFLEVDQIVVKEKNKTGVEIDKSKPKSNSLKDYPLVLLTDELTASASEIVAGALRDNKNTKLIGQKTYGKGVVQELFNLKNGATLKLTVAVWLTPKDFEINKKGLDPDTKVKKSEDSLEVAIKYLAN